MKAKIFIPVMLCLLAFTGLQAQQSFPVTGQQPVIINGLQFGYTIKSTEVKAVGDKGDFSRYSMKFFVSNPTNESRIILYNQGWNVLGNVSDLLAHFDCLNATGARLTSKFVEISAGPCSVLAIVDGSKDKKFVQIGYWIQAGQTISADCIMITPLNELPKIQVTYPGNKLPPAASVPVGIQNMPPPSEQGLPPFLPPQGKSSEFLHIRNVQMNTCVNNQNGAVTISQIDNGWWSAQWTLIPVPGTSFYNIQNRWKGTYLTTDKGDVGLFVNDMSDGARWALELAKNGTYHIRNADSGGYLCFLSDKLELAKNFNNVQTAEWIFEQP